MKKIQHYGACMYKLDRLLYVNNININKDKK